MDIAAWLRGLGLERYEQAFRENEVGLDVLPKLTAEDLKEIGVIPVGDRRRLLEAITILARESEPAPPRAAGDAVKSPPKSAEAERRQLTVMFVDLVGSTALSSRLDPEDMGDVIRTYQNTVAGEIGRFEGHVAKFMGDGVVAYFGWPKAHEGEAERAVRAGLAITAAVSRLKGGGEPLACRAGIATGLVVVGNLVGEGAAQEEAVVGETPNLAARFQGLAEPGQIVIAEGTRRLLGDLFDLTDLGARRVRGIVEPVGAFVVLGERSLQSRFEAHSGPALRPMVGRDQELALLLERWNQARSGEGQGVLLVGEAGIGKSRISRALLDALAQEPHTRIRYQCSPYHADSALWQVIQQLNRAAGLGPDDPVEVRLDKLEALLERADGRDAAPLIADLLGLDGGARYGSLDLAPEAQRTRTLEALVHQLLGLALRQPVLLVLEDAHWIDPTTLELIEQCLDLISDARVLLLLTSRPDHQPEFAAHPHVTRFTLNRLGRAGVEAIVARLGGDRLPTETIDAIIARTDGVPLFVEELTKAILEVGEVTIPASLYDSLMARLDRIPEVKEVAQVAACIGREFDYALLAAVADRSEPDLRSALDKLAATELIFRRGRPPEATYTFKHSLVQDAAYQSLLRRRRQEFHVRVGRALEHRFPERAASEPELLAHHFTEAGEAEAAVPYWQRAGERANDRSANAEAESHLGKALGLIRTLPAGLERQRREISALTVLGRVLTAKSGYGNPEVEQVYAEARQLCEAMPGDANVFPVLLGLAIYSAVRAEFDLGLELSDRLLELARQSNEPTWLVEAHYVRGITDAWRGDFRDARHHLELACNAYRPERHGAHLALYGQDPGPICLCRWSAVLWALGYPEQALARMGDALSLIEQLAHPHSSAYVLTWSAWLRIFRREVDEAGARIEHALAFATEHAYPFWVAMVIEQEGWLLAQQGRKGQAIARLEEGLARMQAVGTQTTSAYAMGLLGEILASRGRAAEGLRLLDEALSKVNRSQERWCDAELLRLRGLALLATEPSDRAAAELAFEQATDRSRERAARSWELRAASSLARLWAEQGERQRALDLLAPVYEWFTEGFDTADLKDAKALLDDLR